MTQNKPTNQHTNKKEWTNQINKLFEILELTYSIPRDLPNKNTM